MATDAIITLERLRCIRESDGTGHSEPFIWPVMIWIDDDTLATPALVGVTAPALGNARIVIKNDMQAGQVANIPSQVRTLRVRLDDNQNIRKLILAVALWENDETPSKAMSEGYKAFAPELGLAVAENLLALNSATTPQEREPIINEIKKRVSSKVESAIKNGLTGGQKLRVKLGTLNLDDIVSSDFKFFPALVSERFNLSFTSKGNSDQYTLEGQLQAVPVAVDPCGEFATRLRGAQQTVNNIQNEIRSLERQLQGQNEPGEPPLPKAAIVAEIRRIKTEELAPAQAALEAARRELAACRHATVGFPTVDGVVVNV